MKIVDLTPTPTVPRDGWDRPLVIPKQGGKPRALTRTTTFIDCIEDKSALSDWHKRMTLVGTARRPDLLDVVRQLDPEDQADKRRLTALAEQAIDIAGANTKREKGTHLHTLSEYVDRGEPLPAGTAVRDQLDMAAYMGATVEFTVKAVEKFVVVPELGTGGTFDRLLEYAGPGPDGEHVEGHFIGDLKTGSVQYGALKMASQLAVYSRGEFYDYTRFPVDPADRKAFAAWKKREVPAEEAAQAYTPLPGHVSQKWGIIINLPAGSGECTLYWVDLEIGWAAAKLAREIRAMRSVKNAMLPWVSGLTGPKAA
ncbi:hypothetical protein EDD96_2322 [Streptomyces sp. Ag109_G2-6]|uniref:hypothetical protein n=1 Tax=Streptomyces sp. Ag109_G2-6 TaxID=2485154 RepID=UPI000F50CF0B|nr:hypothetical protein [Streptomyces sp. Ag109_G2-6]RPF45758.1 hypothetical protein EDD96_2322 [Streptomyces sp. Ag109_G2-6]